MPLVPTHHAGNGFAVASEQGRICALAARGQRDLRQCVRAYPSLFPNPPVDDTMLSALALSTAFIAPWCSAEQLRVANRASLWVTAEDWQVDRVATSDDAVRSIVSACQAVADGAAPDVDCALGQLLAEIRDELATGAGFTEWQPVWREEVHRMLTADIREWEWRHSARPPSFAEYLDNADNYGASFVNVSHWIVTGDAQTRSHLPELIAASREVQRILRLSNDLASYERDIRSGDLNALLLVDREEVSRQLRDGIRACRDHLHTLEVTCPREALYLAREAGFTTGFYHGADYWGDSER
ncbi:terpene synthase family protein [Salinispora arenicola]|uniref:terpene synthase family protein n=1 Tax=Salinispora arenicola TaxID=168697 RepID=UPI0005774814|nr:terpene synthase family protein [Salinispora arenicola]